MLEFICYLPVGLALGAYKLPENSSVIGTKAVLDTKSGNSGVLIRHNATGMYNIFSCGALHSVDQREARRLAA